MGYTTDFAGEFSISPILQENHRLYLKKFATTRRVKRDAQYLITQPDPIRLAAELPIGVDGEFFVGAKGIHGQDFGAKGIIDYNSPPSTQPGLWCQWIPSYDGSALVWDEEEKFYNYVKWLQYLIDKFLSPWGYKLDGEVRWQGEDSDDLGKIVVENNEVKVARGEVIYKFDE